MADESAVDDLLALAQRRHPYLELLSTTPKHKRDVIDALGDSRSTVDRAIEALADAALVTRTDDGAWTTTTSGDVLLETVAETRETVGTVTAAAGLLEYLPCAERVPPALFRDATVDVADGPTPLSIAARVRETVADATAICGFAAADHGTGVKEDIFESTLGDDSFSFDYVFDEALVEGLLAGDEVPWSDLLEAPNARAAVFDGLPFGLLLTDHDDGQRLTLVVYDDQRVVRGQIVTANPEAVAWGADVFERYRTRATPLAAWLE